MGRSPCCDKVGLKKGPWTPEEDQKLLAYIEEHGHGCWRSLPSKAGLQRCGKSCRLRWTNYLRPDIKRGKFSPQEEQTIIQLHALLGNRWSAIASHLPKRTDNEIKNLWNTHLKKRLAKMGIDPATHKPRSDALASAADSRAAKASASLSHMAQWESARLEAEARLVREAKLLASPPFPLPFHLSSSPPPSSSSSSPLLDLHREPAPPPPSLDALGAWQGLCGRGSSSGSSKLDLDEPTSTLTFSDPAMAIPSHHHRQREEDEDDMEMGEEVDWKCFPRPMQLFFDARERPPAAADAFPVESPPPLPLFGAADVAHFGDSFTEMLLNNADEAGKTGNEIEIENEGSRSYWNSIFNLVSSSSSTSSPPSDCVLL